MRQGYLDECAGCYKVQYLSGGINVDVAVEMGKFSVLPTRAVFTYDNYPTKEGNDILAVSRSDDVNGTAVSRRHSRHENAEGPNMKTKRRPKLL